MALAKVFESKKAAYLLHKEAAKQSSAGAKAPSVTVNQQAYWNHVSKYLKGQGGRGGIKAAADSWARSGSASAATCVICIFIYLYVYARWVPFLFFFGLSLAGFCFVSSFAALSFPCSKASFNAVQNGRLLISCRQAFCKGVSMLENPLPIAFPADTGGVTAKHSRK